MRVIGNSTLLFAATVACALVAARVSANEYSSIVERNCFGLKPPATNEVAEAPKPEMPKFTLSGIVTLLGDKRALIKVAPKPGKPGEPPGKEESYILAKGQREGDLEVLEIDETVGSVKVQYGTFTTTLNFDKDAPKSSGPSGGPGGGQGGPPSGAQDNNNGRPKLGALRSLPGRNPSFPMPGGGGAPPMPGGAAPSPPQ